MAQESWTRKDWIDLACWVGAIAAAVLLGRAFGLYALGAYVMVGGLVVWAWKRS